MCEKGHVGRARHALDLATNVHSSHPSLQTRIILRNDFFRVNCCHVDGEAPCREDVLGRRVRRLFAEVQLEMRWYLR